jgi:2-polyprenyl-6-hydroxyphenyl methylase/3-demethylubiquinone-9 3-methyltransferase
MASVTNCDSEVEGGTRFAFGKNWQSFLKNLNSVRIREAEKSLLKLLELGDLNGKSFLDIGSGSGLFSLSAEKLGATVTSFDYDLGSVACAKYLRSNFSPGNAKWEIQQGSVLDKSFLKTLDKYDIVYSWGVLHHTGDMWQAVENVVPLVKEKGLLCIAIYNDQGHASKVWEKIKWLYCSGITGRLIVCTMCFPILFGRAFISSTIKRENLFSNYKKNRGMSFFHDVFDWLGGYPYEVAKVDDVINYMKARGYRLKNLITSTGWGCNQFVFFKE